jgi:cytochrome c oxidase subunit 3
MSAANPVIPATPSRTGVWVGIATITMSFAALTSAMVVRQGAAPDWLHFRLPPILYLNTVILVASSLTLERCRRLAMGGVAAGRGHSLALPWLAASITLGLLFVAGQFLAWRDLAAQGLYLATGPSSAFFYVLTAVHALHLVGGVVALGYVWVRLLRTAATSLPSALGAAVLYWHFVGVLWLYLLLLLAIRL